jgi:integral membrane protein (TIGR01906 family)
MNDKGLFSSVIRWGVAVILALVILMLSIRLLITPLFAHLEYRLPGFPEDPFGFTMEDRLRWAEPSITYLVNSADISYLESLVFEDGESIYNSRELSHMRDVKDVVTGMRIALLVLIILFLMLTILAVNRGMKHQLLIGCERGGWIVIGFIVSILVFLLFSFDDLFTWFHTLFFESGTWKFYTSDTLIRLFPMRFWRDAFISVGVLNLIVSGMVILLSRRRKS